MAKHNLVIQQSLHDIREMYLVMQGTEGHRNYIEYNLKALISPSRTLDMPILSSTPPLTQLKAIHVDADNPIRTLTLSALDSLAPDFHDNGQIKEVEVFGMKNRINTLERKISDIFMSIGG